MGGHLRFQGGIRKETCREGDRGDAERPGGLGPGRPSEDIPKQVAKNLKIDIRRYRKGLTDRDLQRRYPTFPTLA